MPEKFTEDLNGYYAYGGTITFIPFLTYEQKIKLMERFTIVISEYLRHSKTSRYVLEISKEYHKVGSEDDYEAPHYHFIIYSRYRICMSRMIALQKVLREKYGRSQVMLMTRKKRDQWRSYIKKDVERLEELLGEKHYNITEVGPVCSCKKEREVLYEVSEDFDYEDESDIEKENINELGIREF